MSTHDEDADAVIAALDRRQAHTWIWVALGVGFTFLCVLYVLTFFGVIQPQGDQVATNTSNAETAKAGVGAAKRKVDQTARRSAQKARTLGLANQRTQRRLRQTIAVLRMAGIQGLPGRNGSAGPPGIKGDVGARGPAGAQGSPGVDGSAGTSGPTGTSGKPGVAGADGAAGDRGPQGLPGPTGPAGPQGPPGPACPDGYSQREVVLLTTDGGTQPALVCARDS